MQDMLVTAVHLLGPEAFSAYTSIISSENHEGNALQVVPAGVSTEEPEKWSLAGTLIDRMIVELPTSLSDRSQETYLDTLECLVETLEGGSASMRVLGNLTNGLATFCNGHEPIRKRLWTILSRFWTGLKALLSFISSSLQANNGS
jgi:hypothetical protein